MNIRPGTPADLPIAIQFIIDHAEFENVGDRLQNSLERMTLEQDCFDFFVAESDSGEVVGIAIYFIAYFSWKGKSLYLDDLYIVPEYRGKGIGTILLDRIRQEAAIRKCHLVCFQVSDWNEKAIQVYKKIGTEFDSGWLNCRLPIDS